MAFLFMDSFDHYATADLTQKWTQTGAATGGQPGPAIAAVGRRSTQGLQLAITSAGSASSGDVRIVPSQPVPTGATCIAGFAYRSVSPFASQSSSGSLLAIAHIQTINVTYWIRTNGTMAAYRGTSTLLGASTVALKQNCYHYLEFVTTISNTVGVAQVYLDGTLILNLSGLDTQNSASALWDEIILGPVVNPIAALSSQEWDFDDLYLLDGSGATSNAVLNDQRIDVLLPDAVGNSSQWVRSTGVDQWATVDEALQNGDTDYNETSTLNAKDTLNVTALPIAGAVIAGVQVNQWARKTDAGASSLRALTRLAGVDYAGTSNSVSSSYSDVRQIWDRRPSDSAVWTQADVDAAEFGYEKTV